MCLFGRTVNRTWRSSCSTRICWSIKPHFLLPPVTMGVSPFYSETSSASMSKWGSQSCKWAFLWRISRSKHIKLFPVVPQMRCEILYKILSRILHWQAVKGFTLLQENMCVMFTTGKQGWWSQQAYDLPEVESSASCPWWSKICCSPTGKTSDPNSSASGRHPRTGSPSLWGWSKFSI